MGSGEEGLGEKRRVGGSEADKRHATRCQDGRAQGGGEGLGWAAQGSASDDQTRPTWPQGNDQVDKRKKQNGVSKLL